MSNISHKIKKNEKWDEKNKYMIKSLMVMYWPYIFIILSFNYKLSFMIFKLIIQFKSY